MIEFAIYLIVALAAALLFLGLFYVSRSSSKRLPLPQEEEQAKANANVVPRYVRIFPSQGFLDKLKLGEKIKRRLDAGHVKLSPQAFFNLKLLLMAGLTAATYLSSGKTDPFVLAVPLVLGYILPDLWLNKRILARRANIVYLLPEAVDLMGLCVEAGLDFSAALNWIVTKITPSNAMIEELAFLLEEIKWGKSRAQAMSSP